MDKEAKRVKEHQAAKVQAIAELEASVTSVLKTLGITGNIMVFVGPASIRVLGIETQQQADHLRHEFCKSSIFICKGFGKLEDGYFVKFTY